jgi:hypothetical protein
MGVRGHREVECRRVDPDRLQTRCRVGGARARLPDNQAGLDCGTEHNIVRGLSGTHRTTIGGVPDDSSDEHAALYLT